MQIIRKYLFLFMGLTLIGIGTYSFFESYDSYLLSTRLNYSGKYENNSRILDVDAVGDDSLSIKVDDKKYMFIKNDDYYVSEDGNSQITINDDRLIFKYVNQEESIVYEKIKD